MEVDYKLANYTFSAAPRNTRQFLASIVRFKIVTNEKMLIFKKISLFSTSNFIQFNPAISFDIN